MHVGEADIQHNTFPLPSRMMVQNAAALNSVFTQAEICEVLDKVATGKSPGVDGIPVEFFKRAVCDDPDNNETTYILAPYITHLFNQVLTQGYPSHWATAALAPVPKPKGDHQSMDDHRGIAVGPAIAKLYSIALLMRMDTWAERYKMRARGQAGFRLGRGTVDNAFILNHLVEKHRVNKQPLYAAFIDFRKAYDCIHRPLLWECLHSLGVHGNFLTSLMEMYKRTPMQIRLQGRLGEQFEATTGVKQGDPLSPLLFGLFIDRFEQMLADALPTCGVMLGSELLKILFYADDIVLLASSPHDLQLMLNELSNFCDMYAMSVNVKKSEVVIFDGADETSQHYARTQSTSSTRFMYNGVELDINTSFTYLGIWFDRRDGTEHTCHRMYQKGRAAMFAMIKRCSDMELHNVFMRCHLFDSLVRPILNYGCEIWGPSCMQKALSLSSTNRAAEHEAMHRWYMKRCLHVPDTVATYVVMHELRRQPIALDWLKQCIRFWNKIIQRPEDDLVRMALLESCQLNVGTCWAARFKACLIGLRPSDMATIDVHDVLPERLYLDEAIEKWMVQLKSDTARFYGTGTTGAGSIPLIPLHNEEQSVVRSVPVNQDRGFKQFTYMQWFANNVDAHKSQCWWFNLQHVDDIRIIAQFRMSAHWLNIEVGRHARPRVARNCRLCTCCELGVVEDEMHIFECQIYNEIKLKFAYLFDADSRSVHDHNNDVDSKFRALVNCHANDDAHNFWSSMAAFLKECRLARERTLM